MATDVRCVRLFSDADGETHFDDVVVQMESLDFAPPAPPLDYASLGPATSVSLIAGDAGWRGDTFHPAPARQLMVMLRGGAIVTASDGETREVVAGDIAVLEDTRGRGHATRFTGETLIAVVRLADRP